MDHLQAIRIFCRVVETGGFGRAAAALQMPNATVSKWVKSLEVHLGVKLLERSTRRVSVTTDGAAYYERTRHLLAELDDIETTLGRSQASPSGWLRVDTGGAVASHILIPALPAFRVRYPDIQLQLSVTDRTADLVAENIDCAIRVTADAPDLVILPLGRLDWTTCASPDFLAKHGTPEHPNDIIARKIPVAGYFSATSGLKQPLRFRRADDLITVDDFHSNVVVSESNAHLSTALAGLGIVHTLNFMVRESIDEGRLVPILEKWRPDPVQVYLAYPPSRRFSTKVRVFADWAKSLFVLA
jgi:DNA-binding transcriptional LysR family regulator